MPRRTRRLALSETDAALRSISEEHDNMGRLTRRITEFFPANTEPEEVVFRNRIMRREIETYEYRVATLDMGDGHPPQWQVNLTTEIFSVTPPPDGVLRLIETRAETLSAHEAQRRELARPRPPARPFLERARTALGLRGSGTVRHDLPRAVPRTPPQNPTPPSQRPPTPFEVAEQNYAARHRVNDPPILPMIISAAVSVVPNNFEIDEDDLVSSTNARTFLATSLNDDMRGYTLHRFDEARAAMQRRSCSLEKGCQGFCETCKLCQLHCTCPKPDAPKPERRIRM